MIPLDFLFFALTLVGVAIFHRHTLAVALSGLAAIVLYKLAFTGFPAGAGLGGLALHLEHEWVTLANLFLLLTGFAILARHFEASRLPDEMPAFLPPGWLAALALLAIVFVLSAFLDNIAGALIGGTMARHVFRGKVHVAYLAGIVAAANAGGAGSVVGDTTTTMMWIDGISPLVVLDGALPAVVAFLIFGIPAALQQHRHAPVLQRPPRSLAIDAMRLLIVALMLAAAVGANVAANVAWPTLLDELPLIGIAIWIVILATAPLRPPDWRVLRESLAGTIFLLALVTAASLMPVEALPAASWHTTLGLGFVSAIFDNIPLTALALKQGGYDWGLLAYSVGFGGSMIWFGSSAGVAIANMFPEAKSVARWVGQGWYIPIAFVVAFFVALAVQGWKPDPDRKNPTIVAVFVPRNH
jgi:Na+/H+ antiporter NhaD/arsenite permease-like protein